MATAPSITPGEPWIVFQRTADDGARSGVHLIRPDGTGQAFVMAGVPGAVQLHPDWSTDGERLVFSVEAGDGTTDLWVADADGSAADRLVDCAAPCVWVDEPAWSPDGRTILFQRYVHTAGTIGSTIERLDLATKEVAVVLTAPPGHVYFAPRWSPTGRQLLVEVVTTSTGDMDGDVTGGAIGMADVEPPDADVRFLTSFDRFANTPDWSRTGDLVSFAARVDGTDGQDVFTMKSDGTVVTRVTDFASKNGEAAQPSFTPDGRSILFVWTLPTTPYYVMAIVGVDGSEMRPAAGSNFLPGYHPRLRPSAEG